MLTNFAFSGRSNSFIVDNLKDLKVVPDTKFGPLPAQACICVCGAIGAHQRSWLPTTTSTSFPIEIDRRNTATEQGNNVPCQVVTGLVFVQ